MIKNKFLLYLFCGVTMSSALALGECKPTQDCWALGYKEAPCPEQGVKCPFGETWYCPLRCKDGFEWKDGKCEVKRPKCPIGWIYYSDNTCSADIEKNKVPIGVVVYVNPDGSGGQAVNLDYRGFGRIHDSRDFVDLPDISLLSEAKKDFNSCENTKKLLAVPIDGAHHVTGYISNNAPETEGRWCIPAAGVAHSILNNVQTIENTLEKIKQKGDVYAQSLKETNIWTSTEFNSSGMWVFNVTPEETSLGISDKGIFMGTYRLVIEF